MRESFIYVDNELLNDNEPTDVEKVEIVGKNRTEFSILIKYSPWEMYLLETEETEERGKKYKNIYYFLKKYVKFPPKCEIVLVRNGIEERFANVESMPDDDPMRHIKNYLTLFPI